MSYSDMDRIVAMLDAIRGELASIRLNMDEQTRMGEAVWLFTKTLLSKLKEEKRNPPPLLTPEQMDKLVTAINDAVAGRKSPYVLTPEQAHDLATAIGNAVAAKVGTAVRPRSSAPKVRVAKPRAPIEAWIDMLRHSGVENNYDIALQLMREHYPMQEIVRHLHVSPRRIAELRKEAKEKA